MQKYCVILLAFFLAFSTISCKHNKKKDEPKEYYESPQHKKDTLDVDYKYPDEKHFSRLKQLTFGDNNGEA